MCCHGPISQLDCEDVIFTHGSSNWLKNYSGTDAAFRSSWEFSIYELRSHNLDVCPDDFGTLILLKKLLY